MDTTTDTTTTASTADPDVVADPRPQLERALATAGEAVTAVRPDERSRPTPCGTMDVDALVGHLVAVVDRIDAVGRLGHLGDVPGTVAVDPDDLAARWADGVDRARAAWADDASLDQVVRLPWDTMPGRDGLAIYVNELTVHTWDLAQATGRVPTWDPEVVAVSDQAIHAQLPLADRAPIWAAVADATGQPLDPPFADAVEVADDAPAIDRLVAWNGRRP